MLERDIVYINDPLLSNKLAVSYKSFLNGYNDDNPMYFVCAYTYDS